MIAQNAPTGAEMHAQHLTLAEQGCRAEGVLVMCFGDRRMTGGAEKSY